jgi:hypothetical protein
VRTESFLSQAGLPVRQEKLLVGFRGVFFVSFWTSKKKLKTQLHCDSFAMTILFLISEEV